MQNLLSKHWHQVPDQEVRHLLDTDIAQGLDRFEVEHRQARFGPNALTLRKRTSVTQMDLGSALADAQL